MGNLARHDANLRVLPDLRCESVGQGGSAGTRRLGALLCLVPGSRVALADAPPYASRCLLRKRWLGYSSRSCCGNSRRGGDWAWIGDDSLLVATME